MTVERVDTGFTSACEPGQVVQLPISHGEGQYFAEQSVLDELEDADRVLFRYSGENPNGSLRDIAGIVNPMGNVLGMMPHPERASDHLLGGTDGNYIWRSMIERWG